LRYWNNPKADRIRGISGLNYHFHVLRFIFKDNKQLKIIGTN